MEPTRQDADGRGLLIHSAGSLERDALAGILRSAANARAALGPGTGVEVVIQGPGVTLLAKDSPSTEAINSTVQLDVRILACSNSLRSAGLEEKDLVLGVDIVSAAVAHLAHRQWIGWAYVRL